MTLYLQTSYWNKRGVCVRLAFLKLRMGLFNQWVKHRAATVVALCVLSTTTDYCIFRLYYNRLAQLLTWCSSTFVKCMCMEAQKKRTGWDCIGTHWRTAAFNHFSMFILLLFKFSTAVGNSGKETRAVSEDSPYCSHQMTRVHHSWLPHFLFSSIAVIC